MLWISNLQYSPAEVDTTRSTTSEKKRVSKWVPWNKNLIPILQFSSEGESKFLPPNSVHNWFFLRLSFLLFLYWVYATPNAICSVLFCLQLPCVCLCVFLISCTYLNFRTPVFKIISYSLLPFPTYRKPYFRHFHTDLLLIHVIKLILSAPFS